MAALEPLDLTTAASTRPHFQNLERARDEVNKALTFDEKDEERHLELSHRLKIRHAEASRSPMTNKYFHLPYAQSRNDASSMAMDRRWNLPQFRPYHDDFETDIPPAILSHVSTASVLTLKGLLPEIGRAWISVDSTLYLWNYDEQAPDGREGAGSGAYHIYSELDQVITAVAVVRPRRETFQDFIRYVLVIATTMEIVIVGVERRGNHVRDGIHLHPTALRCSTDGTHVNKIVGTDDGRIFLAGSDSYVYEFQYSQDNWRRYFGWKCAKVNMTATMGSYLVPQAIREWYPIDPIVDIAVDNSRQVLYTLSRMQQIHVYDLGNSGEDFRWVDQIQMLAREISKWSTAGGRELANQPKASDCNLFKLVKNWVTSIHVVPVHESCGVHLIACTRNGVRVFLTTTKAPRRYGNYQSSASGSSRSGRSAGLGKPETLRVLSVRLPPKSKYFQRDALLKQQQASQQRYHDLGLPGVEPAMAVPYQDGGKQSGEWNNVRLYIANSRTTILVDKHREQDAHDTLTALVQDSAHEMFARDPGRVESILNNGRGQQGTNGSAAVNPGLCESVHSHALSKQGTNIGRVEALARYPTFQSDIDDTMRVRPLPRNMGSGGNGRTTATLMNGGGAGVSRTGERSTAPGSKRKHADMNGVASGVASSGLARTSHPPILNLDILATQHRTPPDLYLCLTTKKLCRFVHLQPVDQLYTLLCRTSDISGQQVCQFKTMYGPREFAAMCLVIVCCPTANRGARLMSGGPDGAGAAALDEDGYGPSLDSSANSVEAIQRAEECYMETREEGVLEGGRADGFGQGAGFSGANTRSPGNARQDQYGVGVAAGQARTGGVNFQSMGKVYTGRYLGLRQFMARIVRPLWKWTVTVSMLKTDGGPERFGMRGVVDSLTNTMIKVGSSGSGGSNWQELRFSVKKLETLRRPLERLRRLLERNAGPRGLACEQLPPPHVGAWGASGAGGAWSASPQFGASNALVVAPQGSPEQVNHQRIVEQHAVAQLYHLVIRSTQALTSLITLAKKDTHFPRIVAQLRRADQDKLASLTFEDLVTHQNGADLLRKLVSKLMEDLSTRGTNMRRQCIELKRKCGMFFSEGDTLRMTGRDLIRRARRAGPERQRERRDLLIEALRELVKSCEPLALKNPDRFFVEETICEVCQEFCSDELGYYDGVISLALSCAYHLAKGNTQFHDFDEFDRNLRGAGSGASTGTPGRGSPTRLLAGRGGGVASSGIAGQSGQMDEKRLRYDLRMTCYTCVTSMLHGLIFGINEASAAVIGGVRMPSGAMREFSRRQERIVNDLLVRCQDYQDVLFHDTLYSWLFQPLGNDPNVTKKHLYERLESTYVEEWLLRKGGNSGDYGSGSGIENEHNPYYSSLIVMYTHQNRLLEAANIWAVMAKREEQVMADNPNIDRRIECFRKTIALAKSATQVMGTSPILRHLMQIPNEYANGDCLRGLENQLAVAQEQKAVLEAINANPGSASTPGVAADKDKLRLTLQTADKLYKEFAKKHSLWGRCLSIIQCTGNTSPGGGVQRQIRWCWYRLVKQAITDITSVSLDPLTDWDTLIAHFKRTLAPVGRMLRDRKPRVVLQRDRMRELAALLEMTVLLSGRKQAQLGQPWDISAQPRAVMFRMLHEDMGIDFQELHHIYKDLLMPERRDWEDAFRRYAGWLPHHVQPVSDSQWQQHITFASQNIVRVWLGSSTEDEHVRQRRAKEFAYELQDDLLEQINKLQGTLQEGGALGHAAIENAKTQYKQLKRELELFIVMVDRHAQQIHATGRY